MMKKIACKSLGKECDFVAVAETEDEVMEMMMEHVRTDHPEVMSDMEMMSEDDKKKMMDDMKMKMEDVEDEEM